MREANGTKEVEKMNLEKSLHKVKEQAQILEDRINSMATNKRNSTAKQSVIDMMATCKDLETIMENEIRILRGNTYRTWN